MHAKPTVRKCNPNSPTKIHSLDYLATLFSTLKKKWLDVVQYKITLDKAKTCRRNSMPKIICQPELLTQVFHKILYSKFSIRLSHFFIKQYTDYSGSLRACSDQDFFNSWLLHVQPSSIEPLLVGQGVELQLKFRRCHILTTGNQHANFRAIDRSNPQVRGQTSD